MVAEGPGVINDPGIVANKAGVVAEEPGVVTEDPVGCCPEPPVERRDEQHHASLQGLGLKK